MRCYSLIKGFSSTMNDDWQLNLHKVIKYAAKVHGDTEIVSYRTLQGGKVYKLNYKTAYERVSAIANALEKLGIKAGDRIAVLGWNDHRYFENYFSVSGIGAVMLQLNLRLHPKELIYILDHAGAKALFVDDSLLPLAEALVQKHKFDFFILMSDKPLQEVSTHLDPIYGYEELIKENPKEREWEEIDEKSAASACYTSGTTGMPKGVFYSHRAMILHGWAIQNTILMHVDDVYLQVVPLFHANGWGAHIGATMLGTKMVFPGRYTPESLVDIMIKEDVTTTAGAPAIFMPMLEIVRKMSPPPHFNNVRAASGASEPPLSMIEEWAKYGLTIIHAYGATETTPLLTQNHPKSEIKKWPEEKQRDHMRRQGYPVFGIEVKLIDPLSGKELPWDGESVGELWVRGPWIIKEYYNDPRSKEQCTPDGFWKSGDVGTIDELGYFKIVDRAKDLIKSGGEWISSVDMENYLMAHPYVLEAVVVGIPHPRWEERPLALVILRSEHKDMDEKKVERELRTHLLKRFAKWQLPDTILFVNEIPKTSVGKFSKRTIRERYWNLYTEKEK